MFREMVKKKKQIPNEEALELLEAEPRGVLSLQGDDGYPYGVPTNFWYCREDGCVYFHSGKTGHKVDAVSRCRKASLCVISKPIPNPGSWAADYISVIVFGRMEVVEDPVTAMEVTRSLSYQFTDDTAFVEGEIASYGHETLCLRLVPEHITGKRITES